MQCLHRGKRIDIPEAALRRSPHLQRCATDTVHGPAVMQLPDSLQRKALHAWMSEEPLTGMERADLIAVAKVRAQDAMVSARLVLFSTVEPVLEWSAPCRHACHVPAHLSCATTDMAVAMLQNFMQ